MTEIQFRAAISRIPKYNRIGDTASVCTCTQYVACCVVIYISGSMTVAIAFLLVVLTVPIRLVHGKTYALEAKTF